MLFLVGWLFRCEDRARYPDANLPYKDETIFAFTFLIDLIQLSRLSASFIYVGGLASGSMGNLAMVQKPSYLRKPNPGKLLHV